jgi:chromosome segregation ATPase
MQFRGVAFGGFNRQDVLDYVEASASEYARQTEQLQNELNKAQGTCGQQAATLAEAEKSEKQRAEELDRISGELQAARDALAEKASVLEEARREIQALREKIKELEPGAEAYAQIKDRTATIELEAHLRAQRVLDDAGAQVKKSQSQLQDWLRRVQTGYDRLCTDMESTASHISGELGRMQKILGGVNEEFAAHDDALKELLDRCQGGVPLVSKQGQHEKK